MKNTLPCRLERRRRVFSRLDTQVIRRMVSSSGLSVLPLLERHRMLSDYIPL